MDTQRPIEEMTLTELRAFIDAEVQNHAASRAEAEAVEVQLAEVSSSIARLEDAGVAVPDQLREVKLGLHRRLSELTEGLQRVEDVRRHVLALLELMPAPEPVRREPRQRSKRRKRKRSTSAS